MVRKGGKENFVITKRTFGLREICFRFFPRRVSFLHLETIYGRAYLLSVLISKAVGDDKRFATRVCLSSGNPQK